MKVRRMTNGNTERELQMITRLTRLMTEEIAGRRCDSEMKRRDKIADRRCDSETRRRGEIAGRQGDSETKRKDDIASIRNDSEIKSKGKIPGKRCGSYVISADYMAGRRGESGSKFLIQNDTMRCNFGIEFRCGTRTTGISREVGIK